MENTQEGWIRFSGDYKKQTQDIKLFDGTVYEKCWPNAGLFIVFTQNTRNIPIAEVEFVRKHIKNTLNNNNHFKT